MIIYWSTNLPCILYSAVTFHFLETQMLKFISKIQVCCIHVCCICFCGYLNVRLVIGAFSAGNFSAGTGSAATSLVEHPSAEPTVRHYG